jgi:membrane-bound serine protease (ClpP class)
VITYLVLAVLALIALVLVLLNLGASLGGGEDAKFDIVGLVGLTGEALDSFSEVGSVSVRGEIWRATTKRGIIQRGERIRVVAVEAELTLLVERV